MTPPASSSPCRARDNGARRRGPGDRGGPRAGRADDPTVGLRTRRWPIDPKYPPFTCVTDRPPPRGRVRRLDACAAGVRARPSHGISSLSAPLATTLWRGRRRPSRNGFVPGPPGNRRAVKTTSMSFQGSRMPLPRPHACPHPRSPPPPVVISGAVSVDIRLWWGVSTSRMEGCGIFLVCRKRSDRPRAMREARRKD